MRTIPRSVCRQKGRYAVLFALRAMGWVRCESVMAADPYTEHIHCSAGCAVEIPGKDTFESLFRRVDLALYHIKRNEKNDYAFFRSEMRRDNFHFQEKRLAFHEGSMGGHVEMQDLPDAISSFYTIVKQLKNCMSQSGFCSFPACNPRMALPSAPARAKAARAPAQFSSCFTIKPV